MSAADVAYRLVKVYAIAVAVLALVIGIVYVQPSIESTQGTTPIWLLTLTFGVMILLSIVTLKPRR